MYRTSSTTLLFCLLETDSAYPNRHQGHRTYSPFVHLLFTITLLCLYSFALTIPPIQSYLSLTTIIVSLQADFMTRPHTELAALRI